MNEIKVSEFSRYPIGRDKQDGDYNGTRFREDILLPAVTEAINSQHKLIVSFTDVQSLGSSFLEEAFGGLIKRHNISKTDLEEILTFEPKSEYFKRYIDSIWRYIKNAERNA